MATSSSTSSAARATSGFDATYTLEDRYRIQSGRVFLTGNQALVRLPLMQRDRDLAAGLNTAGFISGYRGSPLGTFDMNASVLDRIKNGKQAMAIDQQPYLQSFLATTMLASAIDWSWCDPCQLAKAFS